ncbi:holo-ACP synthase [Treponema brennaborense]|uniref:Holo-[acyl-carrier-protein] synthase n=1 Tax=Treponema brennaborense (strain DSM 12168 / CIP 105900 / DD5/3) TaxID=906968 RepID=F4LKZ8_TREBD|nr:holo-ACP synthase [Treponema brennaborense]AEE16595.1 Holo-(acyl-carrier-protein) synthase [Treponema brennaborense DSM 12168]
MIIGIGIDIVKVTRFIRWTENRNLAERFFHCDELTVLDRGGSRAAESLAVRFAAKEAFGKALGSGLTGLTLQDICVVPDFRGRPHLELHGSAKKLFELSGANTVHVSLSHETEYAVAYVVLEKI